ncbi:MAG: hypothetical protein U9P14_11895 [Gemmatimonadota bacterium]|nr:hypothetical protein [Gemmatimonadota bacterium]
MAVFVRCKVCKHYYSRNAENQVSGNTYECPECGHEQEANG